MRNTRAQPGHARTVCSCFRICDCSSCAATISVQVNQSIITERGGRYTHIPDTDAALTAGTAAGPLGQSRLRKDERRTCDGDDHFLYATLSTVEQKTFDMLRPFIYRGFYMADEIKIFCRSASGRVRLCAAWVAAAPAERAFDSASVLGESKQARL